MNRREIMSLIGGAAAWPVAARAQQRAMPVIGLLSGDSSDSAAFRLPAFREGLAEIGYSEGQNLTIEYRWAEGRYDRLPALAADLVNHHVELIATLGGSDAALAAKAATATIPIVFEFGGDPVQRGLVTRLSRPGGNLTGATSMGVEVGPKRLELLHELVPSAKTIAFLVNANNPLGAEVQLKNLTLAAHTLGLTLSIVRASSESNFEALFLNQIKPQVDALIIGNDTFLTGRAEQLAALSARYALPAAFQTRVFAAAGGLVSYGSDLAVEYRLVGLYAGRILKGERPADLPVQQATKIELVVNLKTAKALGLTVPLSLLGRADEVIE
jgi:putative ABC transport system substrate-binding protein